MASTRNAFELLNGASASITSKSKKKKGKTAISLLNGGDTSSKSEPATPSPLRHMEGGPPMDDFTPATRKGKAKESKIVDLPNIKEAASAEMRAAAEAHSSEELQLLWDGWCSKLSAPGNAAPMYRGEHGRLEPFVEVLRSSKALEASLEAVLVTPVEATAQAKLEDLLQHCFSPEAQKLATKLPQFLVHLQGLLQKTGTADVVKASQEAVSKLVSAAMGCHLPRGGPDHLAVQIADLHLDAQAAERVAANAVSAKDQLDHSEKAESLTSRALQLVCGTTSLGHAKLPGDAQSAMENLTSLISRRLAQAKDGAAGFQQAIANELLELKQSALAVDADIKATEKRLQQLREQAAKVSAKVVEAEAKAAKGPSSGDLNVKAFEQQLQAVEELTTASAVSAVLASNLSQTQDGNLVKEVVAAQVRSLDLLLSSYCEAQRQIVEKAQQAGERLAKNTKRGEQLSLLNMKEEQKRNAKLLEMDQAALQELDGQAKGLVNKAAKSIASLQDAVGLTTDLDLPSVQARLDGLMAQLKTGAAQVSAFLDPTQVQTKALSRPSDEPTVLGPVNSQHIHPVGSPAPEDVVKASLIATENGPDVHALPNGDARLEAHVTAHVALGVAAENKPTENGHILEEAPNGSLDDGDFIAASSRKRRNKRPNRGVATS